MYACVRVPYTFKGVCEFAHTFGEGGVGVGVGGRYHYHDVGHEEGDKAEVDQPATLPRQRCVCVCVCVCLRRRAPVHATVLVL